MTLEKAANCLRYLAACGLHQAIPRADALREIDLEQLYSFAEFHSMTAICCMALEETEAFLQAPVSLQKKWLEKKNKAIRKNLLLEAEWRVLSAWMEEEGIWHCPLKGSILKELYPRAGIRQMADFDILYDVNAQQKVKEHMIAQGYQAVSVGKSNHDVYEKPPVYNFELHTALFGANHSTVWRDYYTEVKTKLVPNECGSKGYHFRDEDFYIYELVHAYKHFSGSGTGLRTLMDVYVYLWRKGDLLDWGYIRQELEKLQLVAFEGACRTLAEQLFSPQSLKESIPLSPEQGALFRFFSGAGTYGTMSNRVRKELNALQQAPQPILHSAKLRYYLHRAFPSSKQMRAYHPICERCPWTIPFFWLIRLLRALVCRRKALFYEVQLVEKIAGES